MDTTPSNSGQWQLHYLKLARENLIQSCENFSFACDGMTGSQGESYTNGGIQRATEDFGNAPLDAKYLRWLAQNDISSGGRHGAQRFSWNQQELEDLQHKKIVALETLTRTQAIYETQVNEQAPFPAPPPAMENLALSWQPMLASLRNHTKTAFPHATRVEYELENSEPLEQLSIAQHEIKKAEIFISLAKRLAKNPMEGKSIGTEEIDRLEEITQEYSSTQMAYHQATSWMQKLHAKYGPTGKPGTPPVFVNDSFQALGELDNVLAEHSIEFEMLEALAIPPRNQAETLLLENVMRQGLELMLTTQDHIEACWKTLPDFLPESLPEETQEEIEEGKLELKQFRKQCEHLAQQFPKRRGK